MRRLSGKRSQSSIPIIRNPTTNTIISDPKEVVNVLAQRFAQHSSDDNYAEGFIASAMRAFNTRSELFLSNNQEDYNSLFSLSELKVAISSSGNTSVGPDDLHYTFFRHLSDDTLQCVLLSINELWQEHAFPEEWRKGVVIAIHKPGKPKNNPDNYRPIALTSCFGKLMERMVAKRLSFVFERHCMLSKYQCGFRKNHSPIDHLVRLETDIRKGFKHNTHSCRFPRYTKGV